jgi:hypothetical protein
MFFAIYICENLSHIVVDPLLAQDTDNAAYLLNISMLLNFLTTNVI